MSIDLSRRTFLSATAAALAAGTVDGADVPTDAPVADPAAVRGQPRPGRPNILWICTDQQRWDTIAALGNSWIRTPHLDRLVAEGVAFQHAYCQSPICTPSRASFLTGRYASTVQNCINGNESWSNAAPLVTRLLTDAGYDCGLAGKLHLSAAQGRIEPRPDDGYRVFHWSHHPSNDWPQGHAYNDWLKAHGEDYDRLHRQLGYIPAPLHQTTWCANMAIEFLRQQRTGPWLFSFNCFDPHPPFDPPQDYIDRFDIPKLPGPAFRPSDIEAQQRLAEVNFQSTAQDPKRFNGRELQARYWAQIELIDEQVGRMLAALEETGQRDNTVVIFTSDHGDMVGDHGLRQKGCRFYDPLVRVPLLVAWPGRLQAGLRSDALVELTDLFPTLLELAGLPVPDECQGRSLLPILTGLQNPSEHRDYVRSEYYRVLAGPPSYATMLRTRDHKLVAYHGLGLGELFDMQSDPGEFNNLWGSPEHAAIQHDMLLRNFDALALATNCGSPRISRY